MTLTARDLDILADELDEHYGSEADENFRDCVTDFAFGDYNFLAHIMIRDLRDTGWGDDLYSQITECTPSEYTALLITSAQILRTHYNGI